MVPTIIAYLINAAKSGASKPDVAQLKHIRFGRSASAPLPPEHHREFEGLFGMPVIEAMGMTETCSIVFCNPHDVFDNILTTVHKFSQNNSNEYIHHPMLR